VHINHEGAAIYPQTIMGLIPWTSYFKPDAWRHQMMLNRQGYGQITVILAANINPIGVRYMKNKLCHVSERSIYFQGSVSQRVTTSVN